MAALLFAAAVFFAIQSSHPLRYGYFSDYQDDPDGVYFTAAGVSAAIAILFGALALGLLSGWFRRHGGLVLIVFLAVLVSTLPFVMRLWGYGPAIWSWPHLGHSAYRIGPHSRFWGAVVQVVLAGVFIAALAAQLEVARVQLASQGRT